MLRLFREARSVMFKAIRSVSGFRLIASPKWRGRRLLILCYHGVSLQEEHEWDLELFVTRGFLRGRFEILRDKEYSVLPLRDAVAMLRADRLPPRSVAHTFYDGAAITMLPQHRCLRNSDIRARFIFLTTSAFSSALS